MGGSDEQKFDHPTQKPVELMRRPILNHTKRGELVYEPFLGSGTTLAAAALTERVCCGMELDPKYVDVIVQRWQDLAGKKATLDGDRRTLDEIAIERGRSESNAAAGRLRKSNDSSGADIPKCKGYAWLLGLVLGTAASSACPGPSAVLAPVEPQLAHVRVVGGRWNVRTTLARECEKPAAALPGGPGRESPYAT